MINPKHIRKIVTKTMHGLGVHEPAVIMLIEGTFAVESNLTNLFDQHSQKHGLMMMPASVIRHTLETYVKYKPKLKEDIFQITGFDLAEECVEAMIDELDTNIKLMVCVLYAYYNYTNEDITDDSLVSVAKFYVKHYKNYEDITIDQFIEKYDQIFMN